MWRGESGQPTLKALTVCRVPTASIVKKGDITAKDWTLARGPHGPVLAGLAGPS